MVEPYIDKSTKSRTKAKNDFEKYIFKLMNNSVFEKKSMKMLESTEILTLQQQTKKEVFSIRTKLSHNKMVFWKFFSNRNEQSKSKNK